jgi:hypothetical protein
LVARASARAGARARSLHQIRPGRPRSAQFTNPFLLALISAD